MFTEVIFTESLNKNNGTDPVYTMQLWMVVVYIGSNWCFTMVFQNQCGISSDRQKVSKFVYFTSPKVVVCFVQHLVICLSVYRVRTNQVRFKFQERFA